jgi:hypothetical protein
MQSSAFSKQKTDVRREREKKKKEEGGPAFSLIEKWLWGIPDHSRISPAVMCN